jgi:hypothetical protein
MKPAIVGSLVGFAVGKSGRPDKPPRRVINDLSSLCRKCRVPATEETPGEIESLRPTGGLE